MSVGRIVAGIATLGASEIVAKPLVDAREDANMALENIKNRKIETLKLGEGEGTAGIRKSGQAISGINQAEITDAGGFTTAKEAGGYIQGLQSQLGLAGPKSALDATRSAAERKLDEATYEASLQDAQQLASQGQSTGARSQALSVLRSQQLAGDKAGLEADLQQDEANVLNQYEEMLLKLGANQGQVMSNQALDRAQQLNQATQFNVGEKSKRQEQQADLSFDVGKALNAQEYQRQMAEYENRLAQIQQQNTADTLALQAASDRTAAITSGITAGIGAAAKVASAGIGGK